MPEAVAVSLAHMIPDLITIRSEGAETCAAVPFRWRGRLQIAIIAKATFSMVQDGLMVRAPPEPIATGDERAGGSQSILIASDLAPCRPRVDVLVRGHARALGGVASKRVALRLAIARDREVVLDKRLLMRGTPGDAGIQPFVSAPLLYDLAPSGPDGENPAGVAPGEWARLINVRHPNRPAGFGPIDPLWPGRRALLPFDRALLDAPIPQIPEPFPWAYFNAAPPDQVLDELRGNEWIGLEGMSADRPRVQSKLPHVLAFARLFGPLAAAGSVPIPLIADTLSIDADLLRCSIVFRGRLTVPSEAALKGFCVVVEARHASAMTRAPATRNENAEPTAPAAAEGPQQAIQRLQGQVDQRTTSFL
jgi:hypothetical protein